VIDHLPHRTERLVLRTLRASDLHAFLAFRARPDVARYQGWVPMSEEDACSFLVLEGTAAPLEPGKWRQIGIATSHDDALIGDMGILLSDDGTTAEIGISMNPHHQGRGLGSEATRGLIALIFAGTAAHRVIARTDARNEAGIRSLLKVGMRLVATRAAEYKGEVCDEHEFAIERPSRTLEPGSAP
jgi:RimJ/RimL family protein N-acetyltransferase